MASSIQQQVEAILGEKIDSSLPISGGCIADALCITTESKQKFFLKSAQGINSRVEANGLKELAKAKCIRVPEVIHVDDHFLVLEYIASNNRKPVFMENLGRQIAKLHRFQGDIYGFFEDNYIGATEQVNRAMADWPSFYWQNRLLYQFQLAEKAGYIDSSTQRLFKNFEANYSKIISGSENTISLLHGDLWSGNVLSDENGLPVIIDPAVYYGDREAEFGMITLFGGFDARAHASYNSIYPLADGFEDRLDLYRLYHIMNHLNLFGRSYLQQMISIIKKYS